MLTLEEIKNVTFHKARNGYQTEDVDDFIDGVIETVDSILRERDDYLKKLDIFAKKVEEYRASEESVGNVLLSAQRLADANVKDAAHKADVILKDAKAKAEAMLGEARAKSETMLADARQQSDKIIADASGNSRRAIASGNAEIERQKELLKKLNAEFRSFQAFLLKRYRVQLSAVKDITDVQTLLKTDEQIENEYPTPKKDELVVENTSEVKNETAPTQEKADDKKEAAADAEQAAPLTDNANVIEDISSSSSVTREPLTSSGDRFTEESGVKFNDFKFGSDFDIHSKN